MKLEDDKRFAMEFQRLAGSTVFFREQLKWMKESLAEYCDAVAEQQ